jgi:hypothetical protein
MGDLGRETAENEPGGVDDEPVALDFVRLGGEGLHFPEESGSCDRKSATERRAL